MTILNHSVKHQLATAMEHLRAGPPVHDSIRQKTASEAPTDLLAISRQLMIQEDLPAMLQILGRVTGAYFQVRRIDGVVLATYPLSLHQTPVLFNREASISIASERLGALEFTAPVDSAVIDIAVTALAHPIRRQIDHELRLRRQLGSVLQQIIDGTLSDADAQDRLETFGVSSDLRGVIVARTGAKHVDAFAFVECPCARHIPRTRERSCAIGLTDEYLIQLVEGSHLTTEHANELFQTLGKHHSEPAWIGVGGDPKTSASLRLSLLEAVEGASRAPGINQRAPLSISRLLRTQFTGSLRERAETLLTPVHEHDTNKRTNLYQTLQVLVDEQYSLVRSAKRLHVHINTVKYRMGQLADLMTDIDLHSEEGRAEIWMALTILNECEPEISAPQESRA